MRPPARASQPDVTSPPRPAAGPARGVVRTPAQHARGTHQRLLPCDALAPYIAHFWQVSWDLAAPESAETLPHPSVHVVFEQGDSGRRAEVAGVHTRRFVRTLAGRGLAFGTKFRPGAFRPLAGRPLRALAERVVPLEEVFGRDASERFAEAVFAADTLEARIAVAEAFLLPRLASPPPSRELLAVRDLVERIATDRAIVRVEDAARLAGLEVRVLQRRFVEYVGVSPKWVIRRYRLHEALASLSGEDPPSLAALAASLGYADQAHFTRDFTATVGISPRRFARASPVGMRGDALTYRAPESSWAPGRNTRSSSP